MWCSEKEFRVSLQLEGSFGIFLGSLAREGREGYYNWFADLIGQMQALLDKCAAEIRNFG